MKELTFRSCLLTSYNPLPLREIINLFLFLLILKYFLSKVPLCNPGCPVTLSVDQAGLKLEDTPAFASGVPGLKVCVPPPQLSC